MTVDGGDWSDGSGVPADQNQDEVWSKLTTINNNNNGIPESPISNAFDGNKTTYCVSAPGGDTTGNLAKFRLTYSFNGVTSVKIATQATTHSEIIRFSDGSQQEITPAPGDQFVTVAAPPASFDWIELEMQSDNVSARLGAIEINGKVLVDATGQTKVTGPLCQGTGDYVSHTANTLELTNAGGRWCVDEQSIGLNAESDDTYTEAAPGWDSTTFQSGNGLDSSIKFDGESCVLREVKWTIEESSGDQSGPWENTTEYTDFVSVEINQEVPPLNQEVTLTPGKFHRVKVQYTADSGADPVESDWNYFKASENEKPQGVRMSGLRFDKP